MVTTTEVSVNKIKNTLNFAGNITPYINKKYRYPANLTSTVVAHVPVYETSKDEKKISSLINILFDSSEDPNATFCKVINYELLPLITNCALPALKKLTAIEEPNIHVSIGNGCPTAFPHQDNEDNKLLALWLLVVNGPTTLHLSAKDSNIIVNHYKKLGFSVGEANGALQNDQFNIFPNQMRNMTKTPYGNALVTTSGDNRAGGIIHQSPDCTDYPNRKFISVRIYKKGYIDKSKENEVNVEKIFKALNFEGNISPRIDKRCLYPANLKSTVVAHVPVYETPKDEKKISNLIKILIASSKHKNATFYNITHYQSIPLVTNCAIPILQALTGKAEADIEVQVLVGSGCKAGSYPHQDKDMLATWFLVVNGPTTLHLSAEDSNTIVQYYKQQGLSAEEANLALEEAYLAQNDQFSILRNMYKTTYGHALVTTSGDNPAGGIIQQEPDCTNYPNRRFIAVSIRRKYKKNRR